MHSARAPVSASPLKSEAREARKQRVLTHGHAVGHPHYCGRRGPQDRDLFLVTEPDGRVPRRDNHGFGLYYHDCCYLRADTFSINGTRPAVVHELVPRADAVLSSAYIPFIAQLLWVLGEHRSPAKLDDLMRTVSAASATNNPRCRFVIVGSNSALGTARRGPVRAGRAPA